MTDHTDVRDLSLGMVAMTYVHKKVGSALKERRETGVTSLIPEERVAAISPLDGTVLGHITRTKKDPVAKVVDQSALMAHIHETDPEGLEDVDIVAATSEQVIAVLREHAPQLLESEVRIRPYALNEALKVALGGKAVPGVEIDRPLGTVNCYPAAGAGDGIEAVIRSGRVALDGTVTKYIEGDAADGAQDT
jgi:hypothetical protein